MAISLTLTQLANSAAQYLSVLDSGEALSTQQVTDALQIANNLFDNWYNEQALAMTELIQQQTKEIAGLIDQLSALGLSVASAYTVASGSYTPATFVSPVFVPSAVPQFSTVTSLLSFTTGLARAFQLALAIEMAPQYDVAPSETLIANAREAKAAAFPVPGKLPVPVTSGTQAIPTNTDQVTT